MVDTGTTVTLPRARTGVADAVRPGLALRVEDHLGIGKLRIIAPEADALFERLLGHAAPPPRTQVTADGITLAWLAPGEWLIIGAEPAVAERIARLDRQGGDDVLALDLGHARAAMILSGRDARLALAAHCPLDLDETMFPIDGVARSLLGDTGMFLARLADDFDGPRFRIVVDHAMGPYAARMLAGAKSFGADL